MRTPDCISDAVLRTNLQDRRKQPQLLDFAFRGGFASLLWGPVLNREENWRTRIPFEFHFDQTTLPPGEYSLAITGRPGGITLRDLRAGKSFPVFPQRREPGRSDPKLVFLCHDRQHFLRQIWLPGFPGYSLGKSRMERDLEKDSNQPALVSIPVEHR